VFYAKRKQFSGMPSKLSRYKKRNKEFSQISDFCLRVPAYLVENRVLSASLDATALLKFTAKSRSSLVLLGRKLRI
jgi:hypothetical protein